MGEHKKNTLEGKQSFLSNQNQSSTIKPPDSIPENANNTQIALTTSHKKFALLAKILKCAIWEYDPYTKALSHFRKLPGKHSEEDLIIENYPETLKGWGMIHPDDVKIFDRFCASLDAGEDYFTYDVRCYSDNDTFTCMRYKAATLKDASGKPIKVIGLTFDVTQEKMQALQIQKQKELDLLTGLFNASTVKEHVLNYLTGYDNRQHALLFLININHFSEMNDEWGHLYGDYVLEELSKMLKSLFPKEVLGRISGDKFLVFLKGPFEHEEASENASQFARTILNYAHTLNLKNHPNLSLSLGVSTYPEDGTTYDALFCNADTALYIAKKESSENYHIYNRYRDYGYKSNNTILKNELTALNAPDTSNLLTQTDTPLIDFTLQFINKNDEIPLVIHRILSEIGRFYDFKYITVIEKNYSEATPHVHYSWSKTPIDSRNDFFKNYNCHFWSRIERRFCTNDFFMCHTLSELEPEERSLYSAVGTQSFIQFSFCEGDALAGYIVFESDQKDSTWTTSEQRTLSILTKLISIYLFRLNSKLELEKELFYTKNMLDNQLLSCYSIDTDTYKIIYINEHAQKLFNHISSDKPCYSALFNRQTPCEYCPIRGLTPNTKRASVEKYIESSKAWYSLTASKLKDDTGHNMYLVCWSDVTAFIERVKSTDSLTGLLTLDKFELESIRLRSTSPDTTYALIYADFNRFRMINEEWGYTIGDEVLKAFAHEATAFILEGELISRINGDQFLFLLKVTNEDKILTRLNIIYSHVIAKINLKYPQITINLSSGIYILHQDDFKINVAIDRANMARKTLKKFKSYVKHEFAFYDDALHKQITRKHLIEQQMYPALKNCEFKVYIQPKVDLKANRIGGAELLVRWIQDDGHMFYPDEFIPLFERNGFISKLDFYMYEQLFKKIRHWLDEGKEVPIISINISRVSLKDSSFIERFVTLATEYNIPFNLIELELTESIFFENLDHLLYILSQLREKGFSISIDDFGTGYSSLNLVQVLPVDILKLDKGFFLKNELTPKARTIILNIINLAKGLGLKIIAEGVENKEQVEFLKETQCDMAQGYYFYKPMPLQDFEKLI